MKKSKTKPKEPKLGQMVERFADYLDTGLHQFGYCFEAFGPHLIQHEKHGLGLLFSQLNVEEHGDETSANTAVIATEDGIRFHTGGLICFNNEQPPEKVALLFLACLVQEDPVVCPACKNCEDGNEEENNNDCMREFIPGFDD